MSFTSVPYAGAFDLDPMRFSWCSVSPTKGFLVFSGNTAAPVTRKLFIQAVYFNGKAAPTFGPACAVGTLPFTGYLQLSMVSITDGRLVVTMKEDNTNFSYSVYDVDEADQVSLAFKHPTLYAQPNGYEVPMVALNNNKVLSTYLLDFNYNRFHTLTVGATSLTVANTSTYGTIQCKATNGAAINSTPNILLGTSIKRDRTGNIFIARAFAGPLYSTLLTHATILTVFNKDGGFLYAGQLDPQTVGGLDAYGCQKGREILPIMQNIALNLGATDVGGNGSVIGVNSFVKLTLGGTGDFRVVPEPPIAYRDTAGVLFHDAIWLDQDYFFALATNTGSSPTYGGVRNGGSWSSTAGDFRATVAYIGKYNQDSNSIVMSDNMPLALPCLIYHGSPVSNYLHKISNTEVAILTIVRTAGNGFEFNVIVVGA
mgnify:CR=1 FL=1